MKFENNSALGDTHNGKAVRLGLLNGQKCIVKPRSANVEIAYKVFLSKMEDEGFLYLPGQIHILCHNESEHCVTPVEHKEAKDIAELHLFYKRCGALLFLSYLFSSTDLHRENIVAEGAFPVVVDYETLLSGDDCADIEEDVFLSNSVWASYLLPRWIKNKNVEYDNSGLTGFVKHEDRDTERIINSNIAYYRGNPSFAWEYKHDIIEGFNYSYRFFMNRKNLANKWINVFQQCDFRVILRRTSLYLSLVKLIDGIPDKEAYPIIKGLLERAYKRSPNHEMLCGAQKIIEAEVHAVMKGEVPLFWAKGNGTSLLCQKKTVQEDFWKLSPVEKAKKKLEHLSERDRLSQIQIISQVLSAAAPLRHNKIHIAKKESIPEMIMDLIEARHIKGMPDGWLYLNREKGGAVNIREIGIGVYHGLMGIICFYSAVYYKCTNDAILHLIKERYKPFKKYIDSVEIVLNDQVASFNVGVGGIILALCHIYELTGEKMFLTDVETIITRMVVPEVLPDGFTDIMSGYSALAVALGKYQTFYDKQPLLKKTQKLSNKIRKIAKAILSKILYIKPELTGYAHGAAGYSLAIGSLAAILKTDYYDNKILELLRWENSYFNDDMCNWRDLRINNQEIYMCGWCSGKPGIIMARQALSLITTSPIIKALCNKDIEKTKNQIDKDNIDDRDCLCCGSGARIIAISRIGTSSVYSYNRLKSRMQKGNLNFTHLANTCDFNPGLMQGYAGIGYGLAMYGDPLAGGMFF